MVMGLTMDPYNRHLVESHISFSCQIVGCDHQLGSTIKEDNCGVCNGDGSTCRLVRGQYKSQLSATKGKMPQRWGNRGVGGLIDLFWSHAGSPQARNKATTKTKTNLNILQKAPCSCFCNSLDRASQVTQRTAFSCATAGLNSTWIKIHSIDRHARHEDRLPPSLCLIHNMMQYIAGGYSRESV